MPVTNRNPDSVEEWLALVAQHEAAARALVKQAATRPLAFKHAGLAVEFALKAYIFARERFNAWPSRSSRPDLYTHDVRRLREIAGILLDPFMATAPAWLVVQQWDRLQDYNPEPMPRKVALSMIEAAFGEEGVVTWLRQTLI